MVWSMTWCRRRIWISWWWASNRGESFGRSAKGSPLACIWLNWYLGNRRDSEHKHGSAIGSGVPSGRGERGRLFKDDTVRATTVHIRHAPSLGTGAAGNHQSRHPKRRPVQSSPRSRWVHDSVPSIRRAARGTIPIARICRPAEHGQARRPDSVHVSCWLPGLARRSREVVLRGSPKER